MTDYRCDRCDFEADYNPIGYWVSVGHVENYKLHAVHARSIEAEPSNEPHEVPE